MIESGKCRDMIARPEFGTTIVGTRAACLALEMFWASWDHWNIARPSSRINKIFIDVPLQHTLSFTPFSLSDAAQKGGLPISQRFM